MNDLREQARHHWQGILGNLGISGSLKNKHQPCPCCGGKDRFRFDDKDGYGTFICNQCGAGDGFRLVMNLLQCDFKHAASIVESYLGNGWVNAHPIATTPAKTQEQPEKQQDKQAKLLSIFEQAKPLTPDSPAVQYLHQRGITLRARAYCSRNSPNVTFSGCPALLDAPRRRAYAHGQPPRHDCRHHHPQRRTARHPLHLLTAAQRRMAKTSHSPPANRRATARQKDANTIQRRTHRRSRTTLPHTK